MLDVFFFGVAAGTLLQRYLSGVQMPSFLNFFPFSYAKDWLPTVLALLGAYLAN